MPDRIVKPDTGNDLVLQNDDASAKIEINEAGTVVATPSVQVDNIKIDGNTITSEDTDGNIQLTPNGTGTVVVTTDLDVDYLNLNGNAITSTNTDGNINLTPNGSGSVIPSKLDVSSGTFTTSTAQKQAIVDGATIEAQDLASGSGTTLPNNVQDAITRLGTVTSGTFNNVIGSSATFPNGHIIQVVLGNSATESSGTGDQLAVAQSITLSDSSNKLLAFGALAWSVTGSSRDQRFGGIKIATSGSGTNETFLASVTDSTGPTQIRLSTPTVSTNWRFGGHAPINYLFSPAYAGSVTVSLYGVGYDSDYGVMTTNRNDNTHGHSTLILMELVA